LSATERKKQKESNTKGLSLRVKTTVPAGNAGGANFAKLLSDIDSKRPNYEKKSLGENLRGSGMPTQKTKRHRCKDKPISAKDT